MFVQCHLDEFLKTADANGVWQGEPPLKWASSIKGLQGRSDLLTLSAQHESREILLEASLGDETSMQLAVRILAWGGMRSRNGRRAFECPSKTGAWLKVVDDMRRSGLSAVDAYERFKEIGIPGMGPAYYTKLIYFCVPDRSGLIMDQWTARSVNLLTGTKVIKLNPGARRKAYVATSNDQAVYKEYCRIVVALAERYDVKQRLGLTETDPEAVEKALFSVGRGKGAWRNYVSTNG